jgi:hypothetical protein
MLSLVPFQLQPGAHHIELGVLHHGPERIVFGLLRLDFLKGVLCFRVNPFKTLQLSDLGDAF